MPPPKPLDLRRFEAREHALANGLSVRLLADRNIPTTSLYTFYRVGSRDERPGRTGMAHLFEHLLFLGSERFGPKEFDRILADAGGDSNAYTTYDYTAYSMDFASEALELVLDCESERMRALSLSPETLASEREVVKEERRYSVDSSPFAMMNEALHALAYTAHPYRWPIIGWMDDIEAISREDCLAFFAAYYAPNNALLWASGDFEPDRVIEQIERFYGAIPRAAPPPPAPRGEPVQRGERRAELRLPAHAEAVAIGYKGPRADSPHAAVLDVAQYVLSAGHGARLVRRLVYDQSLAASVYIDFTWRIDEGLFVIEVDCNPGVPASRVLWIVDEELHRLATRGPTEEELVRAKGMLRTQVLRELSSNHDRANTLGSHEVLLGRWRPALDLPERYAAVSVEDVRAAAAALFRPDRRSVVTLVPTAAEGC